MILGEYVGVVIPPSDKHKPAWACFRVLGLDDAALFAFRWVWALKFGYSGRPAVV